MLTLTVDEINKLIKENPGKIIADSEKRYSSLIKETAKGINEKEGRVLVMVAGPSSSGKTTTSKV